MAGQGGGLALVPWLLGGLSHGRKKRGGLALIPCLLAFWGLGTVENVAQDENLPCLLPFLRLGTVGNVMRAEKVTVSFGNIGVRHGIVTPRIKEVTNPFIKRIFVRCSIRHP